MSTSLQVRNTRSLLTWLPLVMLGGFLFLYGLMRTHVRHMQEEQLKVKQANVWSAFGAGPGNFTMRINGEYDIVKVDHGMGDPVIHPRDTILYAPSGKMGAVFAYLSRTYMLPGSAYRVTTYTSSEEFNHLLIKVFVAEVLIFLLLLSTIVLINRRVSRRLWAPFYETMGAMGKYDIRENEKLIFPAATGIGEFDRLNQTLGKVIDHVDRAYKSQKQFTENAAHELQTPLAIIRSKAELLIEDPALTEDTAHLLSDIVEANERLSEINKNLLLLTRIDTRQYLELQAVPFSDMISRIVGYYQENGEESALDFRVSIQPDMVLFANAALIEIMIDNLLRNAMVHNVPGGYIEISLTDGQLYIENSGPVLEGDTERLFERFQKGKDGSRSTGLGLTLVRQICQLYHYDIQYRHTQGIHSLTLGLHGPDF
jgi:signal transduction histidine kinase